MRKYPQSIYRIITLCFVIINTLASFIFLPIYIEYGEAILKNMMWQLQNNVVLFDVLLMIIVFTLFLINRMTLVSYLQKKNISIIFPVFSFFIFCFLFLPLFFK